MPTAREGAANHNKVGDKRSRCNLSVEELNSFLDNYSYGKIVNQNYLTFISHVVILVRSREYIFSPNIKS